MYLFVLMVHLRGFQVINISVMLGVFIWIFLLQYFLDILYIFWFIRKRWFLWVRPGVQSYPGDSPVLRNWRIYLRIVKHYGNNLYMLERCERAPLSPATVSCSITIFTFNQIVTKLLVENLTFFSESYSFFPCSNYVSMKNVSINLYLVRSLIWIKEYLSSSKTKILWSNFNYSPRITIAWMKTKETCFINEVSNS